MAKLWRLEEPLVLLVLLPGGPKLLNTTQFPCTPFTAVYIRHPQTKLKPLFTPQSVGELLPVMDAPLEW